MTVLGHGTMDERGAPRTQHPWDGGIGPEPKGLYPYTEDEYPCEDCDKVEDMHAKIIEIHAWLAELKEKL